MLLLGPVRFVIWGNLIEAEIYPEEQKLRNN